MGGEKQETRHIAISPYIYKKQKGGFMFTLSNKYQELKRMNIRPEIPTKNKRLFW